MTHELRETEVHDLMRRYTTDDEPPLRLTLDGVRTAAVSGEVVTFTSDPRTRRRWVAPVAAAVAAGVMVGGFALARLAGSSPTTTTPAGGGSGPATSAPTVLPSATTGAPGPSAGTPATALPALLDELGRNTFGEGNTLVSHSGSTWTLTNGLPQDLTNDELEKATSFSSSWKSPDGKRTFSIEVQLRAQDLTLAERRSADEEVCFNAEDHTCSKRALPDGWTLYEITKGFGGSGAPPKFRSVNHFAWVSNGVWTVSAGESLSTPNPHKDLLSDWTSIELDALASLVTDPRVRFEAPDPLPAYPSFEYCHSSQERLNQKLCQDQLG